MPVVSDHTFLVTLPSGGKAVYCVQPQYINPPVRDCLPELRPRALGANGSLTDRCIRYGTQLAHENGSRWYEPGGWKEITDLRQIALLERCPEA